MPQTGRTHQLRVHLRAIDRPIVGDELYAEYKIKTSNNLELKRLALHSHVLDIILPKDKNKRLIAPLPMSLNWRLNVLQSRTLVVDYGTLKRIYRLENYYMKTAVTGVNISPVNMEERSSLGLRAGDTVRVHQKIQDKGKTRIQIFEGLVLARKHGNEARSDFYCS
jgi:hypothetical protein